LPEAGFEPVTVTMRQAGSPPRRHHGPFCFFLKTFKLGGKSEPKLMESFYLVAAVSRWRLICDINV